MVMDTEVFVSTMSEFPILDLPLELLYDIVTMDPFTWKSSVLSLPFVWRSFACEIPRIKKKFIVRKENDMRIAYFLCGKLHREDGPALVNKVDLEKAIRRLEIKPIIANKYEAKTTESEMDRLFYGRIGKKRRVYHEKGEYWFVNGKLHREDGPCFVCEDPKRNFYCRRGEFHSYGDEPAIIGDHELHKNVKHWYRDGKLHRENGPALLSEWLEEWYIDGKLHRDGDEPAKIDRLQNITMWAKNGERHRDGDEPALIVKGDENVENVDEEWYLDPENRVGGNMAKMWYKHGKLHRDGDKPALVRECKASWYKQGEHHRKVGPASISTFPKIERWWYLNGVLVAKEMGKRVRIVVSPY